MAPSSDPTPGPSSEADEPRPDESLLDETDIDETDIDETEVEAFDVDAEEARLRELFADPRFAKLAAERGALPVARRTAEGSIGRALALGFANVFDPDRKKDEVQAIQERGDDDPDGPSLDLDRDDPKASRITLHRRKR